MQGLCSCTAPSSLTQLDGGRSRCNPSKFAKMIFVRDLSSNYFVGPATNPIDEEASWSGLPDAADDTLHVVTPNLEAVEFVEAEILEEGENIDGAPIREGNAAQEVRAMLRNPSKQWLQALNELACYESLAVIFIDRNGHFWCREVATDQHAGFPISPDTIVTTDPSKGAGLADKFKTTISFFLKPAWMEEAVKKVPESGFFPLTEIVPS